MQLLQQQPLGANPVECLHHEPAARRTAASAKALVKLTSVRLSGEDAIVETNVSPAVALQSTVDTEPCTDRLRDPRSIVLRVRSFWSSRIRAVLRKIDAQQAPIETFSICSGDTESRPPEAYGWQQVASGDREHHSPACGFAAVGASQEYGARLTRRRTASHCAPVGLGSRGVRLPQFRRGGRVFQRTPKGGAAHCGWPRVRVAPMGRGSPAHGA